MTMKILFICTHNRCRSIIAEAVTNYCSNGRIDARSAGSQPAGEVHPLSLRYLQARNIPVEGLASQGWDEYEDWHPDVVITVCDAAAGEQCPVWFGQSLKQHWGLADPSRKEGSESEVASAFFALIDTLQARIDFLLEQPIETLEPSQLQQVLRQAQTISVTGS